MCMCVCVCGGDFSYVLAAALLYSLSEVNICLRILQEFKNNFLKVHLRKAIFATPYQITIKVKDFELKHHFNFPWTEDIVH